MKSTPGKSSLVHGGPPAPPNSDRPACVVKPAPTPSWAKRAQEAQTLGGQAPSGSTSVLRRGVMSNRAGESPDPGHLLEPRTKRVLVCMAAQSRREWRPDLALVLMETLILGNFMYFPRLRAESSMEHKQCVHLITKRPKISL